MTHMKRLEQSLAVPSYFKAAYTPKIFHNFFTFMMANFFEMLLK